MDLLPYVVDLMLEVADLNLNVPDLRSAEIRLTLTPAINYSSGTLVNQQRYRCNIYVTSANLSNPEPYTKQ